MNTNVSELNAIFNILNNPSLTCLRSRRWVRVWTYLSFSTSSNYYLKDTSLLLDTVGLTLTKQLDFKTTQFDIRRSINPNSSLVTNLTYTQALSLLGKTRETRAWHQLINYCLTCTHSPTPWFFLADTLSLLDDYKTFPVLAGTFPVGHRSGQVPGTFVFFGKFDILRYRA